MTTYYTDAYDDRLGELQRTHRPESPAPGDTYPTVVPTRCHTCRRLYAVPATATVGTFGGIVSVDNRDDLGDCPPCRTRTEQGALW